MAKYSTIGPNWLLASGLIQSLTKGSVLPQFPSTLIHSLIHPAYLFGVYFVPSTIVSTKNKVVIETDISS